MPIWHHWTETSLVYNCSRLWRSKKSSSGYLGQEKMYRKIFARSFSKHDQKKPFTCAFFGCLAMALSLCALLNSYMGHLPLSSFQLARSLYLEESVIFSPRKTSNPPRVAKVVQQDQRKNAAICNFSLPRSDFCEINGDVRIHGNSSTIYISPSPLSSNAEGSNNITWRLKPYPRKFDGYVMKSVRELTLGSPSSFGLDIMPQCSINHTVPAIVFSTGGYSGNHFHAFTDVLVPLYITSRPFNRDVQFLVTNIRPARLIKYKVLLDSLSRYPIIDMDNSNEVHCFESTIVGLKSYKEFDIDPAETPQSYSMRSFTQFVRNAYSLRRTKVTPSLKKPRLLIISRKRSRAFLNVDQLAALARSLGYKVEISEASSNLQDFSKKVNSFDVMVGVHGAGLTNSVFLPEKAILIQVVPIGLSWLAVHDFELPAISMNLRYLEYKVEWKESTLADKYPPEHPMITDASMKVNGWVGFQTTYLDGQKVRIDVGRFRATLLKSLELLQQ